MTAIDSWLASLKVPEVAALVSAAAALVSLLFAFFVYWRMSQGKVIVTWRLREPGVPVIDVLVKNTGPNGERRPTSPVAATVSAMEEIVAKYEDPPEDGEPAADPRPRSRALEPGELASIFREEISRLDAAHSE